MTDIQYLGLILATGIPVTIVSMSVALLTRSLIKTIREGFTDVYERIESIEKTLYKDLP